MAQIYVQTDDAPNCSPGAFCSGLSAGANPGPVAIATIGGTPGVSEDNVLIDTSASDERYFYYELTVPVDTIGDAGTWTVRLNNTSGDSDLTLASIHICRVNSSCTNQETIGSATGLSDSLDAVGVVSTNVTGSEVTMAVGDKVVIVVGASNASSMFTRTLGFTPDQNVDSPFTVSSIDAAPGGSVATKPTKTSPLTGLIRTRILGPKGIINK